MKYSDRCRDIMRNLIELDECELLGMGAEGSVFLTPEGYALKSFNSIKSAKKEADILNAVKASRFFPNVLLQISNLVVRECVEGQNLKEYIAEHGLSKKLAFEIIEFVEDMKRYNFKRVNIRNAHIFVNEDENLMVIDPRKVFTKTTPYPKDIIKVFLKLRIFDDFLNYVSEYDPRLTSYWIKGYYFVAENNKVSRYG